MYSMNSKSEAYKETENILKFLKTNFENEIVENINENE